MRRVDGRVRDRLAAVSMAGSSIAALEQPVALGFQAAQAQAQESPKLHSSEVWMPFAPASALLPSVCSLVMAYEGIRYRQRRARLAALSPKPERELCLARQAGATARRRFCAGSACPKRSWRATA